MRLLLALAALVIAAPAWAEPCTVATGVDYRFERAFATRTVDDAKDRGPIRLAAYIYRPLKANIDTVALFSHGSTGGQFDPAEPQPVVQCALKNYFLTRGYTLVVFTRRGRGESTGTYVEECAPCPRADERLQSDRALQGAVVDGEAVLDQIVRKLSGPRTRVLLVGHSRGGVLSLALAAARPKQIAAVLNFAGGWLGVQSGDKATPEDTLRQTYQQRLFARLGQGSAGPSLWVYAARDPLYDRAATDAFHAAFTRAGGRAEAVFVADHPLPNGHLLVQESPLWAAAADAFLARALPSPNGTAASLASPPAPR